MLKGYWLWSPQNLRWPIQVSYSIIQPRSIQDKNEPIESSGKNQGGIRRVKSRKVVTSPNPSGEAIDIPMEMLEEWDDDDSQGRSPGSSDVDHFLDDDGIEEAMSQM